MFQPMSLSNNAFVSVYLNDFVRIALYVTLLYERLYANRRRWPIYWLVSVCAYAVVNMKHFMLKVSWHVTL